MFHCVRKDLHPEFWVIPLVNKFQNPDCCFLCVLNQLSSETTTSVQKQVSLELVHCSLEDEKSPIVNILRQNVPVVHQVIDLCGDLYSNRPLQDLAVQVCVLAIDRLQQDDCYMFLLETFKDAIETLSENAIDFSMSVVSSLQALSPLYMEILVVSFGDTVLSGLLDKAEFMNEGMTVSLLRLLIPVVKQTHCLTESDSYGQIMRKLMPLLITWLNKSQSLDMKRSVVVMLKEVLRYRESVLSLLSLGISTCNVYDTLSQTSTPPDCPFLMGLKRMMTCKQTVLTITCVNCLTQILGHVSESEHLRQIMASDVPEFVFESLHTKDSIQLEATLSCLQALVNTDEFFQRCHAVYGIDATLNAVKESIDCQRLSVADSGLHLLWCLLDRQPENMPLLLNYSLRSCYQLIQKALQHENNTIFISSLQAASAFLRPQHQQSPVDIQAIISIMCILMPKSLCLLNKQNQQQPSSSLTTNNNDSQVQSAVLNNLMDVIIHITSLFQSDSILPGNDKQRISELKHIVQSFSTDLVVSKDFITFLGNPEAVQKYLNCINACLFIQFDNESQAENQPSFQIVSKGCFPFLLISSGLPWLILRAVSPHRCPHLEEQASKLVIYILINCMEPLPSALRFDSDFLMFGLTQLEWTKRGLNVENIPTHREALLSEIVLLYFSYLYKFRPWPFGSLCYFLHQVFYQCPSFLSLHPVVLRSTVYFLAISEDLIEHDGMLAVNNYGVQRQTVIDDICTLHRNILVEEMIAYTFTSLCLTRSQFVSRNERRFTSPELMKAIVSLQNLSFLLDMESAILTEMEKTSLELWYTDCVEVLMWTLSSQRRNDSIGAKTVEYWLHRLTLMGKTEEEVELVLSYFKGCLTVFYHVIDFLGSGSVGKMAQTILLQVVHNEESAQSREDILKRIHGKLELAFSQTPNIDETSVENILPILCQMIEAEPTKPLTSLHSVKLICHCAKYLTRQEREHKLMTLKYLSALVKQFNSQESKIGAKYLTRQEREHKLMTLKYLSALVKQFNSQESKIVIPPLMQNTKFVSLLASELSNSDLSIHSHILTLCAWLATHGADYQAYSPLTITTSFLLSSLASCRLADTCAILQLLRAALISAKNGHKSSGAVDFVRSHQAFFSCYQIFDDLEIHQIFYYIQQYLVQDIIMVKKLAFDILEIIRSLNSPSALQLVQNPWNSLLLENILTMKTDSSLCQAELQLCSMLSASDGVWTEASANSLLLGLTCSNLDSTCNKEAQDLITQLKKKCDFVDSILLDEAEKHITALSSRV